MESPKPPTAAPPADVDWPPPSVEPTAPAPPMQGPAPPPGHGPGFGAPPPPLPFGKQPPSLPFGTPPPPFGAAPPAYSPPYGRSRLPEGQNGFATAAMVLGIIALILFWYFLVGIVLGALAIGFGIGGRIAAKSRGLSTSKSTIGMVLGGLAIVLGVLILAVWASLFHHIFTDLAGKSVTPTQYHAQVTQCSHTPARDPLAYLGKNEPPNHPAPGYLNDADGTIENTTSSLHGYVLTIEFLDAHNTRMFTMNTTVNSLSAGESAHWHAAWPEASALPVAHCTVLELRQFAH